MNLKKICIIETKKKFKESNNEQSIKTRSNWVEENGKKIIKY